MKYKHRSSALLPIKTSFNETLHIQSRMITQHLAPHRKGAISSNLNIIQLPTRQLQSLIGKLFRKTTGVLWATDSHVRHATPKDAKRNTHSVRQTSGKVRVS